MTNAASGNVELLEGLRAGDPEAYRKLVELNSANVYNVALKLLGEINYQVEAQD